MTRALSLLLGGATAIAVAVSLTGGAGPAAAASAPGHGCRQGAASSLAAVECARIQAVPSLQPVATNRPWRQLVRARRAHAATDPADCRPLRAVFYTAGDWLRLATKLAANASPCAEHYISIPPLTAEKTQPRRDQAWRIRALGAGFHAMAEINLAAWRLWVSDTGGTWYEAGVEARRRMADNGYDVSAGDTWAVNELSSAVRRGEGTARADARAFVRGLFDGDGILPTARGAAFVVGIGQGTLDLSTYKAALEGWLQDAAFWADMSAYVSDWSQEVYGDVRAYGVAGSSLEARRDYLNDYLQHKRVLATVGPEATTTARSYLQSAYSPLANAAWQWDFGFGWTLVPADQMKHFVSAQTYALRYAAAGASAGGPDRAGFAWAPKNTTGLPSGDFTTQTAEILDRLAAAIHDSGAPLDPDDPGVGACGPLGQNLWCAGEQEGARFNDAWKDFTIWGRPTLAFGTTPQTLRAGSPSQPMAVQLQTVSGIAQAAPRAVAVTLTSSSPGGAFSTSPAGSWTSTLALTIPAGASASASFYYLDTKAGSPTLTATASGSDGGTQAQTVVAGPLASIAVSPSSASVVAGGAQTFTAVGTDAYSNPVTIATAAWSVSAETPGAVFPATGSSTTFTAGPTTGSGGVIAVVTTETGMLSSSASVTVVPAPAPPPPAEPAVPALPALSDQPAAPPPTPPLSPPRSSAAKTQGLSIAAPRLQGRRILVTVSLPRRATVTVALWRSGKRLARTAKAYPAGRRVALLVLPRRLAPGRVELVTTVRAPSLDRTRRSSLTVPR